MLALLENPHNPFAATIGLILGVTILWCYFAAWRKWCPR